MSESNGGNALMQDESLFGSKKVFLSLHNRILVLQQKKKVECDYLMTSRVRRTENTDDDFVGKLLQLTFVQYTVEMYK